ncbi:hypothetical protein [Streptomyces sp. NPDC047974]|uniref:hypothetical protein n=1 Tax=Streptomyces sp. NPDC047974 TaxID=3154343 RepID=UPI0033DE8255
MLRVGRAHLATSGVRALAGAALERGDHVLIVAVALGIIPMAAPDPCQAFPESARIVLGSGIGCLVAVLLDLARHPGSRARHAVRSTEFPHALPGRRRPPGGVPRPGAYGFRPFLAPGCAGGAPGGRGS